MVLLEEGRVYPLKTFRMIIALSCLSHDIYFLLNLALEASKIIGFTEQQYQKDGWENCADRPSAACVPQLSTLQVSGSVRLDGERT